MSVLSFKDGGSYLGQFLTQVSVVCPKCGGHALAGRSRIVCEAGRLNGDALEIIRAIKDGSEIGVGSRRR